MTRPILMMTAVGLACLALAAPAVVMAQPGGDFVMTRSVLASGGGRCQSSAFVVTGTLGQAATGTVSGGEFVVGGGFWGGGGLILTAVPGEAADPEGPAVFRAHPPRPNPFNPSTTIMYELPFTGPVQLTIYDVLGRVIRCLRDGEIEQRGRHEATWNGKDDTERAVAAGVYIYRLKAGVNSASRRLILVK